MLALSFILALAAAAPPGDPASAPPALTEAWSVPLAGTPRGEPFELETCDGPATLLAIPYRSELEARRIADGSVAWRIGGDADLFAGHDGHACGPARLAAWQADAAGEDGRLLLVDPATGAVLRAEPAEGRAIGPPVTAAGWDGWLVPLAGGRVALFAADGRLAGHVALGTPIAGDEQQLAGRPLARAAEGGTLLRADGGPLAARRIGAVDLARTAVDGRWFAGAGPDRALTAANCRLRRRDRLRCRRRWTQHLAGAVAGRPLLDEKLLYVSARDTHVYAFRRDNGHLLWRTGLGHRLAGLLRLGPRLLLVAGEKTATLFLVSAEDGTRAGTLDTGDGNPAAVIVTGPAAAGELAVVAVLTPPATVPELVAFRLTTPQNRAGRENEEEP